MRCQQVDDAARRVITEAGYASFSAITPVMLSVLKSMKNRFFTAGHHDATARYVTDRGARIYLPGQGGVRIEDVVLVTPKAQKCSTPCRKQCCSRERHKDLSLLKALSEADAIASSEQEYGRSCWKKRIACKKKFDLTSGIGADPTQ